MKKFLNMLFISIFVVPLFAGGASDLPDTSYDVKESLITEYNSERDNTWLGNMPSAEAQVNDFFYQESSQTSKTTIIDELQDMANNLVQEKAGSKKPTFAFLPLATDYKNALVEDYVVDALIEAMFNTGKIKIIERARLDSILEELMFQQTDLVNEDTAKSIGLIASADFVCYGTLKDLGDSFIVNARVVDVETGELCAISRATITKDAYLKQQSQSAVESPRYASASKKTKSESVNVSETTTLPTVEEDKPSAKVINSAWKVVSYKDEFGGFTKYIFTIKSIDEKKLFVSYQRCENSVNDRVIAGIYWGYDNYRHDTWGRAYTQNEGSYDIKGQSGNSVTKKLLSDASELYKCYLNQGGKDFFWFAWDEKAGSRWLVDILVNSESVAIRRDGVSRKFQTAGLLDKMAEYGISWEEIDAAMANEEF